MEAIEGNEEEELHTGAEDNTPEEKHYQSPAHKTTTRRKTGKEISPLGVLLSSSANGDGGYVIATRPRPLSSLSLGRVSIVMATKVHQVNAINKR